MRPSDPPSRLSTPDSDEFVRRHVGPDASEQAQMLASLEYRSVDALLDAALPAAIRHAEPLTLPPPLSEAAALSALRALAERNRPLVSMIGLGHYNCVTPAVIRRNVLESPSWYTAYTPYQPEISQGRLEALLNFQTVVADLTGLPTANASLLDEATAAAEGLALAHRTVGSGVYVVDRECWPQTIAVVRTRARALGIDVVVADLAAGLPDGPIAGVLHQYPAATGQVLDPAPVVEAAHARGALVVVAADLLALTLLRPPGEVGADVVVGSSQRLGVPLAFGGPHAGFIAVRQGLERSLPGRLVGVSVDADGHPGYRLALQTREQHIRRERATSNICTAQALPAILASMYAVHHGPDGLRAIARRVHGHAAALAAGLRAGGVEVVHDRFFDTVLARVPDAAGVVEAARREGVNLRAVDSAHVGIACDETTSAEHVAMVARAFGVEADPDRAAGEEALPVSLARSTPFLTHPVFHQHRSETSMVRYLRRLADADVALDRSSIPLGSCTMKLNGAAEMEPITWPGFADVHPFAPLDQAAGYLELIGDLECWLAEITGYDAVSLQPNAGSQGEFAGLLAVQAYHRDTGQAHRDVCLIPSSAHGTNAASATMAGLKVVVVACDDNGDVDLADLQTKIARHHDRVAVAMLTYPSTHGVYEAGIVDVCGAVHGAGGQVYVDGANLNALVGLVKPGRFGADVSHLNLHKTFCVPHGGGGPGVGPVAVRSHLAPYLPNHPLIPEAGPPTGVGPVSGTPWGSAGVLPISWAYLRLMGADGLATATGVAVLSANYVAARLRGRYPLLYAGANGLVAHECVIDLRPLTAASGVTTEDVAKRLIDYGFHAPTMSFPVAGTLMIEPTESENLRELDRFCDAMLAIRDEIARVAEGRWPSDDNPLRNAPHTAEMLVGDWPHPYSRKEAVYPLASLRQGKYWPPVRRIDGAAGDRNLVCSCPPVQAFALDTPLQSATARSVP